MRDCRSIDIGEFQVNGKPHPDDLQGKPIYLAALKENNLPADSWGPRRRAHHYGPYAHLNRELNSETYSNSQHDLSVPYDEHGRYSERF